MRMSKKFFIILIIQIGLAVFGYMYFLKMTKPVDVVWTYEDYKTAVAKTKMQVTREEELTLIKLLMGDVDCVGQNYVDDVFTNEEISALLSKGRDEEGAIVRLKVKSLGDDEVEASFMLGEGAIEYMELDPDAKEMLEKYPFVKYLIKSTPLYIKAKLNRTQEKEIDASIQKFYVGNIKLPSDKTSEAEKAIMQMINAVIVNIRNVSIADISFEKDKVRFKGKLPVRISGRG